MSTAIHHTHQELLRQQEAVFSCIPGMNALRHAAPESVPELELQQLQRDLSADPERIRYHEPVHGQLSGKGNGPAGHLAVYADTGLLQL